MPGLTSRSIPHTGLAEADDSMRKAADPKPTASVLMPTLLQKPFQQLTWRMWRLITLVSKTGAVAHNLPIGMRFGSRIEHLHIKLLVD